MLLTKILKEAVEKFPNSNAFSMKIGYRTKSFTYLQVYNLAKKTALFLDSLKIKKGDRILIFASNSPYYGILFWASILSGIVLVPVNVQSTDIIIKKILEQIDAKVIFKGRFLKLDLSGFKNLFDMDFLEDLIGSFNEEAFKEAAIFENDLVEILYTSGTTGDPKGVLLTHKNIYSNIEAVKDIIPLAFNEEKLLSILPLSHIFEQTIGFFLPQVYASHIIFAHSYSAILDLMNKYKVTKFLAVPEFLKVLHLNIEEEYSKKGLLKLFNFLKKIALIINNRFFSKFIFYPIHKKFGGHLNTIASGGAFLDPQLEKEWQAFGITVLQGYGLTETSPLISCNTYKDRKVGSVGKIVSNVDLKIDGGQILVKGPGVFKGYFNNEEKTKEAFTEDGFFKTGDIGYIDKDGYLFLKGRKKYLIIGPGGQNVFPEDIEFELNKINGVKDSCVIGLPLDGGLVQIHAVLLLNNKIDPERIIELTNKKLASYQKINGFTVWSQDDFPRSATRKIKRDEVIKIIKDISDGKKYVDGAKNNPLFNILSSITGIALSEISLDKKIIEELQLDSLMRVELILRIEEKFNTLIDESVITEKTTVLDLQTIIRKGSTVKKRPVLKKWPRSVWASFIRAIVQFKLILFSKVFFRLNIVGLDNIKNLKKPVVFMPNHISYSDPLALLMALPRRIRQKLVFAAASDVLYQEYKYVAWLAELTFNTFPLPRANGQGIKYGLDFMGSLIDEGYSIVVFPEGAMSKDGNLLSLKKGAGLMAVEMRCSIIPVKITGTSEIVPYCKILPRKIGRVVIKFGKPINFDLHQPYEKVAERIECELDKL
jgi:long-chain acyl-CoA synthetase